MEHRLDVRREGPLPFLCRDLGERVAGFLPGCVVSGCRARKSRSRPLHELRAVLRLANVARDDQRRAARLVHDPSP
jgi:hypothetical protein